MPNNQNNQNSSKEVLGQAIIMLAKGDENTANQIVQIISKDENLLAQVQDAVGKGATAEQLAELIAQGLTQGQQNPQAASLKVGAKIEYLNTLKGICPKGQELVSAKNGCKVCRKKAIEKDKCGKKMKPDKKQYGGLLSRLTNYKKA